MLSEEPVGRGESFGVLGIRPQNRATSCGDKPADDPVHAVKNCYHGEGSYPMLAALEGLATQLSAQGEPANQQRTAAVHHSYWYEVHQGRSLQGKKGNEVCVSQ